MTSRYTVTAISEIINGKLICRKKPEDGLINTVAIDSRKVTSPDSTIFFAIKGVRHNAHRFIGDLYERGCRHFIISEPPEEGLEVYEDACFIKVDHVLKALQKLAEYHRSRFNIPMMAITGSNGKTTVKEWLYQLLYNDKNIVRSPRSYNSQVGVPLSVLQIDFQHELAIFEAGISFPGEMQALHQILQPSIGIFTNIGTPHNENFKSTREKIDEKLRLFKGAGILIYNKDYAGLEEAINEMQALVSVKKFTWSREKQADIRLHSINKDGETVSLSFSYKDSKCSVNIPFTDEASIENMVTCIAVMLHLGYAIEAIQEKIAALVPVAMRLELKEGINRCTIINDSYNSDIGSLNIALDLLKQQNQHKRKSLILSDIFQSGKSEEKLYAEIASMVNRKKIQRIIGVGEGVSKYKQLFKLPDKQFFSTTNHLLEKLPQLLFSDEAVLIKGARTFGFEKISAFLEQKVHQTTLEINLDAVVHNFNYFRSKLLPETRIMVMVKAFSYGSGSHEIANVLEYNHVDYLAVAYADEGVELRKAGIKTPVLVMNPEPQSFGAIAKYDLEPEIYSLKLLKDFEVAMKKNLLVHKLPFIIHLKLDTGMHRLGFAEEDLPELISFLHQNQYLRVKSIFSHLAASDEPEHDQFTKKQIDEFIRLSSELKRAVKEPESVLCHILNSGGIQRFPEAQMDMVRLGIGLYGVGVNKKEQKMLQNVSTLKTRIAQVKSVKKGETIGYGCRSIAKKDMKLGIVSIGYADGFNRRLGNGNGEMQVNGQRAKTVGNICMDMCMLDLTGISAREGDEVVVFGEKFPVSSFAEKTGTIAYEVLTGISRRVKRVYYQE